MNKKKMILAILFVISGIFYYFWASGSLIQNYVTVTRIVDGDTVELANLEKVRLLGINTPEKNMLNSELAVLYLTDNILNKNVTLESDSQDKYGRNLGYIFLNGENVNKNIVENGYAHIYYYDKDKYYNDFKKAEESAREQELGIWEKSENYNCLELIKLLYNDDIYGEESLVLNNNCGKSLTLTIKDDATHIYKRELKEGIYTENFSHIFNDDGDSLFVWDEMGLVEFYRYEN